MLVAWYKYGQFVYPPSSDVPTQISVRVKNQNGKYFAFKVLDAYMNEKYSSDAIQITSDDWSTDILDGTILSSLDEGFYVVELIVASDSSLSTIDEVAFITFMVANSRTLITWEEDVKARVYVTDTFTMVTKRIDGMATGIYVPYGRFLSAVHLEKDKRGRLIMVLSDGSIVDTGWGSRAIIELTYRFNDLTSMFNYCFAIAYAMSENKDYILDIAPVSYTHLTLPTN